MYGLIVGEGKFFFNFNKKFLVAQATCEFSSEKFGKRATFAPESRTKLGATFLTDSRKKPSLPRRPSQLRHYFQLFQSGAAAFFSWKLP